MANQPKNERDLHAKIIAHAWKNPSFKEKLLKTPRAALKEMGVDIPENTQIKIIEDKSDTFTFVLPALHAEVEQLSDRELEQMAGGIAIPTQRLCTDRGRTCKGDSRCQG